MFSVMPKIGLQQNFMQVSYKVTYKTVMLRFHIKAKIHPSSWSTMALVLTMGCLPWTTCLLFGEELKATKEPTTQTSLIVEEVNVEKLVERARILNLQQDPFWLTLLHYHRGLTGWRSLVDDDTFFLSKVGKRDAWAELELTVRGMCDQRPPFTGAADPLHPGLTLPVAARFPARTAWLCERLGISPQSLPQNENSELATLLAQLRPREAQVVFASGYLSSPASMFGHTLIVIRGTEESQLLAQGINYAASLPPGAYDPLYVFKGLLGFFPGLFSTTPYHRKVQEYSDLDQRDLWEYRLNFTPEEVTRLLQHAWELRGIWSDYWFFDENCSFNLLFLLQAARPGLHLTERAGAWVLPVDTVRWLAEAELVAEVVWRPSLGTRVKNGRVTLGDDADRAIAIARGEQTVVEALLAVPELKRQAQILDLAGECLHALAGRRAITQADYRGRLIKTLAARAQLGPQPSIPLPPTPTRPDQGHASTRVQVGIGREHHGNDYLSFGLRPALHDLLDPPAGYLMGSSVAMGSVDVRWRRREGIELRQLDVISLVALNPWDPLFRRWSWDVVVGEISETMASTGDEEMQARLMADVGYSANLGSDVLAWAMVGGDARGFAVGKGWALGPTGTTGLVWSLPGLQFIGQGRLTSYLLGERDDAWTWSTTIRAPFNQFISGDISIERRNRWDVLTTDFSMRLNWYF
jgi:hypothetical protein